MHERSRPVYSSDRPRPFEDPYYIPAPTRSAEEWQTHLSQMDGAHQADVNHAVEEAAALQADVHLYSKIGSKFLGIALQPSSGGDGVKIYVH